MCKSYPSHRKCMVLPPQGFEAVNESRSFFLAGIISVVKETCKFTSKSPAETVPLQQFCSYCNKGAEQRAWPIGTAHILKTPSVDRRVLCSWSASAMRVSCQLTKHFAQLRRVPHCDWTDKQKWDTGLSSRLTSPVCLPPATLHLCRGALVILLRNLDPERGLCNGARAILVRASTPFLEGRRVFIPRIPMTPTEWTLPVKLVRQQFPIRLAWAMTINKSQGQTLERTLSFFAHFGPRLRAHCSY